MIRVKITNLPTVFTVQWALCMLLHPFLIISKFRFGHSTSFDSFVEIVHARAICTTYNNVCRAPFECWERVFFRQHVLNATNSRCIYSFIITWLFCVEPKRPMQMDEYPNADNFFSLFLFHFIFLTVRRQSLASEYFKRVILICFDSRVVLSCCACLLVY